MSIEEVAERRHAGDTTLHLSDGDLELFLEQVMMVARKFTDQSGLRVAFRFQTHRARVRAFDMLSQLAAERQANGEMGYNLVLGGVG